MSKTPKQEVKSPSPEKPDQGTKKNEPSTNVLNTISIVPDNKVHIAGLPDDAVDALYDLRFIGFKPDEFRTQLASANWTEDEIKIAICAYVQLGNNPRKATDNQRKPKEPVMRVLAKITKETSLTRIALSHPGWTYDVRKAACDNGLATARFPGIKAAAHLQDPALLCFMDSDAGKEFNLKFSEALIASAKNRRKNSENTDWWTISWQGATDEMRKGLDGVVKEKGKLIK
jgi:hypothetical protein